jgi:hypothetical protein
MSKRDKNQTENTYKNKREENDENYNAFENLNTNLKDTDDLCESYLMEMHDENVHECVVESLSLFKKHIKEKSLRMGQLLSYGDLFDFFFK